MEVWQFFVLIAVISFYSIIAINRLRDITINTEVIARAISNIEEKTTAR